MARAGPSAGFACPLHHAPDARSRRLSCWKPGFQLWVTLLGKACGVEPMPSEESPVLTLWFACPLSRPRVRERKTNLRCITTGSLWQPLLTFLGSLGRKGLFWLTFWAWHGGWCAEAGGGWSYRTHSQQAEKDECWCVAPFLLYFATSVIPTRKSSHRQTPRVCFHGDCKVNE